MIEHLPHRAIGYQYSTDLPFLTLKGCGLHYIDSHTYSWDNRQRPDQHCLIQYCVDGEGALEFDRINYPIRSGDAFIVDIPGENRYWLPKHSSHWEVLYLEFSKECLSLIWKIHQKAGPVIHLTEESGLPKQMFAIYEQALNNKLDTIFANSKATYSLWMDLTAYVLTSLNSEPSKIDNAKLYIDQNYPKEDLSLDLLAESVGLSKSNLCREFRRKFGLPPGQYLKNLRISQACRLLTLDADYTVQDVARMVGYPDNNYFGKVFRAAKGISPDRYRKQSVQYDIVRTIFETPQDIYTPGQIE